MATAQIAFRFEKNASMFINIKQLGPVRPVMNGAIQSCRQSSIDGDPSLPRLLFAISSAQSRQVNDAFRGFQS
jgi:hypothetical protein